MDTQRASSGGGRDSGDGDGAVFDRTESPDCMDSPQCLLSMYTACRGFQQLSSTTIHCSQRPRVVGDAASKNTASAADNNSHQI
jgi:hypothetical protein